MVWLGWVILLVSTVVGLVGAVVPAVPGCFLIFCGALVHKILVPGVLSWVTIVVIGVLCVASAIVDALASVATARLSGAGKWGLWGAAIGGFAGLFFVPVGLIAGPIIGAFSGELLFGCRHLVRSLKAGAGAGVGVAIATLLRIFAGLVMVVAIGLDLLV